MLRSNEKNTVVFRPQYTLKIVSAVGNILEMMCRSEKNSAQFLDDELIFIANIETPLDSYLRIIFKHNFTSCFTFAHALFLVDKLINKYKMNIDKRKMHKLIVTVLLICTKYNEDHAISSKALALISGIDNFELNIMENLIF